MDGMRLWQGDITTQSGFGRAVARASSRIDFLARVRAERALLGITDVTSTRPFDANLSDPAFTELARQAENSGRVLALRDHQTGGIGATRQTGPDLLAVMPLDMPDAAALAQAGTPDGLRALLFGQPPAGLHPNADASWSTFAVIEAARHPMLPELIDVSNLPYVSLFGGDLAEEAADAAPYLVELREGNGLLHDLFAAGDGPRDLWSTETGILLRADATLIQVRAHLRPFTRVRHESGAWHYFRFYDPRAIGPYMQAIRHKPDFARPWFAPLPWFLIALSPSTGSASAIGSSPFLLAMDGPAPVRVDWQGLAHEQAFGQIRRFSEEEGIPYIPEVYAGFDYAWEAFETRDLHILVLRHGHFKDMTPYDPLERPEAVRKTRRDGLFTKLMFWKRQGVPYGLHDR